MNKKHLVGIIVLFLGIFAISATIVNAGIPDVFCLRQQPMTVILKDDADLGLAKEEISKIHQIKIESIQDRNKEWSRMVNKMDLPKMDNPFKNEVVIKISKKADADEISNQIKSLDFVEDIKSEDE